MAMARVAIQELPMSSGFGEKYARAENASRKLVLMIGTGAMACLFGTIVARWVLSQFINAELVPDSETAAIVLGELMVCFWALSALPLAGWMSVRFLEVTAAGFTFTAGLAGEVFSLMLRTAVVGIENAFEGPTDLAMEIVLISLGFFLTWFASRKAEKKLEALSAEALVKQQVNAEAVKDFVKPEEAKGEPPPPAAS